LLVFIVTVALVTGLIQRYISNDISAEDFKKEQLVNGRYYYLKTKTVSLNNIEYALVNSIYKKVYNDKFLKKESINEKWEDLQTVNYSKANGYHQSDQRRKVINKNGVLTFDKAFIEGNYFTCIECVDAILVEEEVERVLPIDQDVENIFKGIDINPWHGSPKRFDVNRLYDLQFNHNATSRKKNIQHLEVYLVG